MSKGAKRYQQSHQKQRNYHEDVQESNVIEVQFSRPATKPIEALTSAQGIHLSSLRHDDMVIGIGPAGTGKTWLASAVAADLYMQKHVKQIILTRPNVEVGKSFGALPGDLDEKYAPYLEPFQKGLIDRMGSAKFKADFKKRILAKPLAFMRGATYDDAVLLLDEAQNTTIEEMKMFLTRVGTNSRVFITGDVAQTDIKCQESGLAWLVRQIRQRQKPYDIIEYRAGDCVRSGFCKDMLDLIENAV